MTIENSVKSTAIGGFHTTGACFIIWYVLTKKYQLRNAHHTRNYSGT